MSEEDKDKFADRCVNLSNYIQPLIKKESSRVCIAVLSLIMAQLIQTAGNKENALKQALNCVESAFRSIEKENYNE